MQKVKIENLLVIDIETVPFVADFSELSATWKKCWEEKVQRILPPDISAADFYSQRAGVMAEFAKVICISMGYFNKTTIDFQLKIKSFFGDDEKIVLKNFIAAIHQMQAGKNGFNFCGHNIKEFDIPFICRRLLINGLAIPTELDFQNMKPWETNIVDTFQYWRFGDYKNFTSLTLLATALNVPSSKDDIDGSRVADVYWKENNLQRIVTYCQKDVATTANIILRFNNLPLIETNQVIILA